MRLELGSPVRFTDGPLGERADVLASDEPFAVTDDRVPKGEFKIRRPSSVVSLDGKRLGTVDGFLVGKAGRISCIVPERRHVGGRRRIMIPVDAVSRVGVDAVRLLLTRGQVDGLPSLGVRVGAEAPRPRRRRATAE